MKTCEPKSKAEQRVLAYCNRIRAKFKKRPRKTFVCGLKTEHTLCPIARTLGGAKVYDFHTVIGHEVFRHPRYVTDFIYAFDEGQYPHLVE